MSSTGVTSNGKRPGKPSRKPDGGAKATKTHLMGNLQVGKRDVSPSAPSHTRGVRQGNRPAARQVGMITVDGGARATARRSTSINPEHRDPIDPRSPKLSPA
jgi:hypothetical protein